MIRLVTFGFDDDGVAEFAQFVQLAPLVGATVLSCSPVSKPDGWEAIACVVYIANPAAVPAEVEA